MIYQVYYYIFQVLLNCMNGVECDEHCNKAISVEEKTRYYNQTNLCTRTKIVQYKQGNMCSTMATKRRKQLGLSGHRSRGRFEAVGSESAAVDTSIALSDVDGSCDCSVLLLPELAVEIICDEPLTDAVVEDGSRAESVNFENLTETQVR